MKASLFTLILATTVLSGHAAFAMGGLNKHDNSIAQYSYNTPIIDTSMAMASSGTSLRDDMDKGYKPEPAPTPTLQPATSGTGYKPSVPAPAARKPGSGYVPSVPAPAVISPRVEAAPAKTAPAMPTPLQAETKDSNDGHSAAADVKVDANTNTNANINSNVTSSATAAPLATPDVAKEVAPPATATKPVAPAANNAAFGNVLNPVPAAPTTTAPAATGTTTPAPAAVTPPAPQSSATPQAAPAVTGTNGITVSGAGTSTPVGSTK